LGIRGSESPEAILKHEYSAKSIAEEHLGLLTSGLDAEGEELRARLLDVGEGRTVGKATSELRSATTRIFLKLSSLRGGLAEGLDWGGDDIGAVDEPADVLASNSELGHGGLEVAHHQFLVVNHGLPLASSALKKRPP
jgi:hypothetical protein